MRTKLHKESWKNSIKELVLEEVTRDEFHESVETQRRPVAMRLDRKISDCSLTFDIRDLHCSALKGEEQNQDQCCERKLPLHACARLELVEDPFFFSKKNG